MDTNNGKQGGLLKGKPHYDKNGNSLGGIKAVITDSANSPVELEGGEVIINKAASEKHWKELSKINQSAGGGVPIVDPSLHSKSSNEYGRGGGTGDKIEFNANHTPNKWVYEYAKKIKENYPKVWALGGNEYGNEAFKNLERAFKRGHWVVNEEWMYVKWQSFNARHKGDFRIAGVIANLKWLNKVEKGWDYMKTLIDKEIQKRYPKGWKHKNSGRFDGGGVVTYKNKYNKKYGYDENESHNLKEISKDTEISNKGLQQIYNKGIGAYKTNPQSVRPNVKSKEQWAMARVYSSVMGGKAAKVDANELKMNNGGGVGEISKSKVAKMQKIKVNGLGGLMPGVKDVYYNNVSNKFYFADFEGDFMELKNTKTLEHLESYIKQNNVTLKREMVNGGGVGEIKKGRKNKNEGGDCYEVAGRYSMDNMSKKDRFLVHAQVVGQGSIKGLKYGHAWIEDEDFVYEMSNGRDLKIDKDLYYMLGVVDEKKPLFYRYKFNEAVDKMVTTGHFGPWDLKTETGL